MSVAAPFRDKNWSSWRNSMRCLHAWDIPLRDNGWKVEIKQKEHGASIHHSQTATADVRPKWVNFQDFFFILGSYFKPYLSDLRRKLSYKIAHIFSVLLMYFSLKIFRKILGRDVPYVIPTVYCYICQTSIHE